MQWKSLCQQVSGIGKLKVEMMGIPKECVYMERRYTIRKATGGSLQAENTKYIYNKQTLR